MQKKTTSSIPDNYILKKIKHYCKIRGLSVYKLAKYSDIPYSSLNNIFIRNTEPTMPTLRKICTGLGISMSEFFENLPTVTDETIQWTIVSPDEQWILETYRKLSKNDKKLLNAYLQGLAKL